MSRIVVVDDHEPLLDLFRDVLGEEGHEVVALPDADVEELAALRPHVLIVDVQLGHAGLDLISRCRLHPALCAVPVIAVTADIRVQRDLRPELKRLRARLLLKPFTLQLLLERLTEAGFPSPAEDGTGTRIQDPEVAR